MTASQENKLRSAMVDAGIDVSGFELKGITFAKLVQLIGVFVAHRDEIMAIITEIIAIINADAPQPPAPMPQA